MGIQIKFQPKMKMTNMKIENLEYLLIDSTFVTVNLLMSYMIKYILFEESCELHKVG